MAISKKKMFVAASVAGLIVAATGMVSVAQAGEAVPCYGINACKGAGDCGGKGHDCGGKNACKGAGFVKVDAAACTKIAGGSLTAAQ